MTPQLSQPADKNIDAELDRLTYSAYLLTLDPGLALSLVMAALDDSLGKPDANLLGRTVELSLQQLRLAITATVGFTHYVVLLRARSSCHAELISI